MGDQVMEEEEEEDDSLPKNAADESAELLQMGCARQPPYLRLIVTKMHRRHCKIVHKHGVVRACSGHGVERR